MVKTLKNLLKHQESFEAESRYIKLGTRVYQVCSNDDRRLTFDFLRPGQICNPMHFYGENVEKWLSQMY